MKLRIAAVLILAGIIAGGCGEAASEDQANGAQGEVPEAPVGEAQMLDLGETAEVGGLTITPQEAYLETPGMYDDLGPDQTYLIIKVRAQNASDQAIEIAGSGVDFIAYNQDSFNLEIGVPDSQIESNNRTDSDLTGTARPGADITGTLAYVVERETDEVVLEYAPAIQGNASASWIIGPARDLEVVGN